MVRTICAGEDPELEMKPEVDDGHEEQDGKPWVSIAVLQTFDNQHDFREAPQTKENQRGYGKPNRLNDRSNGDRERKNC